MTSAARDLLDAAKKLPPDERQAVAELLGGTSAAWEVFDEAKKLSLDERQTLAKALWDSLEVEPTSLSPEWTAGVSSRIAQLERGEVTAIPWTEVEVRLRRTLGVR